ncbi:hypothetical protein J4437_04820 [Candidatus Woesearchaeota archaeon]|nr:hypothetical protein [Candidatus Woesearchaeota archaeon]
MRLTRQKIEEILQVILGQESVSFIRMLADKDNISEFELATKTKKDIKVIRRMLYFLYNHNLVSFNRKKDKIKGWYIYYWTLLPESIKYYYIKTKKEKLINLKKQLDTEKKELFYTCPSKCTRLDFDKAIHFEFHCPECGELVMQDSSEKKVQVIIKEITDSEKELESLEKETTKKIAHSIEKKSGKVVNKLSSKLKKKPSLKKNKSKIK